MSLIFNRHPGESRDPCDLDARAKGNRWPLLFILSLLWVPAFAGMTMMGVGVGIAHAAPSDQLKAIEQQLQAEQQQQQTLNQKLTNAKGSLSNTQDTLVRLAASIRANEQDLTGLDGRIGGLSSENDALTARLQKAYGSISNLVLALERIRRIPPESLIARPGAPLQTAESAMLLETILPTVADQAKQAEADLDHLNDIRQALQSSRQQASTEGETLKIQDQSLQSLLAQRKQEVLATEGDLEENQKSVARIARQAQDMRDLMAKLEDQERKTAAEQAARKVKPVKVPKAGIPNLPVAGGILTAYGDKDEIGAISEGIKVKAKPGAIVVAPMGGIVKFAGAFRTYGELIIIEHEDDYHSLVAGLGKIGVTVGQSVKSGEPLGNMPVKASSDGGVTLYYELRHNGKPVDPASKLKDLRS
jgi:septal ring factor EnvC (AmiA/AmiB activator)